MLQADKRRESLLKEKEERRQVRRTVEESQPKRRRMSRKTTGANDAEASAPALQAPAEVHAEAGADDAEASTQTLEAPAAAEPGSDAAKDDAPGCTCSCGKSCKGLKGGPAALQDWCWQSKDCHMANLFRSSAGQHFQHSL